MRTYYLPISSQCLAHYLGCALLKPSRYFTKKPSDIQNRFEDYLLLTVSKGCQECNCCLEVVLTEEEEQRLISVGGTWFLLPTSLPITRVKKIYFRDEQHKNKTLTNTRMGTAFVPDSLVGNVGDLDNVSVKEAILPEGCYTKDQINVKLKDQTREITLYDRILGSLVMMRLAKGKDMTFSPVYLDTVAFFNRVIAQDFKRTGKIINDKYTGLYAPTINGYTSLLPYLTKRIDIEDVKVMAQLEGQQVVQNRITRKIELEKLDKRTYILGVLATYGVGNESRREKIDGVILSNFEGIKSALLVAQCYGYNRGYSVFNSYYATSEDNKVDVKFKLESQLDYYTIESVYQYVFNNRIGGRFDYLDGCCNKLPIQSHTKDNGYYVLDTLVVD